MSAQYGVEEGRGAIPVTEETTVLPPPSGGQSPSRSAAKCRLSPNIPFPDAMVTPKSQTLTYCERRPGPFQINARQFTTLLCLVKKMWQSAGQLAFMIHAFSIQNMSLVL